MGSRSRWWLRSSSRPRLSLGSRPASRATPQGTSPCCVSWWLLSSTLAIWPYDAPHRVGITRRPLGLFAYRGGRPTRKKSLDTKGIVFAGAL
jgi:hypothetical protein